MSDDTIRSLERRARQGDYDALVSWLVERVKHGLLTQERLEAAAVLKSPEARDACRRLGVKLGSGEGEVLNSVPMVEIGIVPLEAEEVFDLFLTVCRHVVSTSPGLAKRHFSKARIALAEHRIAQVENLGLEEIRELVSAWLEDTDFIFRIAFYTFFTNFGYVSQEVAVGITDAIAYNTPFAERRPVYEWLRNTLISTLLG